MLINPSIKYIIRREGEHYRLYSVVDTDFAGPATNFIREVGIERGYAILEATIMSFDGNECPSIEYEIGENYV